MSKLRKKLEELRSALDAVNEASGMGRIKTNLKKARDRGDQAKIAFWQALKEVQDELKVRKNDEETRQKYLAARSGLG